MSGPPPTGIGAMLATALTPSSGTTVEAVVNSVITTVQVIRGLTVAANDVILVQRVGSQWFALALAFPAAAFVPDNGTAPNPKPPVTTGSLVVSPTETRSYRPTYGWRTDNTDVYQGEYGGQGNHSGCAFYGTKPRSLVGATVTGARIRVRRITAGTYAPQSTTLRLLTQATRPGGAPTLGASTGGPSLAVGATNDNFGIPTSWAQAMVNGTAGGLAVFDGDGSPYVRFAGRGTWSPAFTLTINWRRG